MAMRSNRPAMVVLFLMAFDWNEARAAMTASGIARAT
jgi:hypothetical protein